MGQRANRTRARRACKAYGIDQTVKGWKKRLAEAQALGDPELGWSPRPLIWWATLELDRDRGTLAP